MRRLIASAAMCLGFAGGCATPGARTSPALPTVTTLTIDQIHQRLMDDKAAHKVAVAHFWATWCGPCVEEFPRLAKTYDGALKSDSKIDFFAVAVDSGSVQDVASFAGGNAATFPIYLAIAPEPGEFAKGMASDWPGVLPTTFVYGPDGRLQIEKQGEIDDLRLFVQQLKSLEGSGS